MSSAGDVLVYKQLSPVEVVVDFRNELCSPEEHRHSVKSTRKLGEVKTNFFSVLDMLIFGDPCNLSFWPILVMY